MKWLSDALLLTGAGAGCFGIGLIYFPAGIICAGLFVFGAGALIAYVGTLTPGKRNAG